ncbi:MAG: PspA-associated protein PspAA [Carbonactinosporaceae bacterium]
MIVRIMGEGQFEVADDQFELLNALDESLSDAVESGDDQEFQAALGALLARVRGVATPLPSDALEPSELILPSADLRIDEVRDMLGDEGLIPG